MENAVLNHNTLDEEWVLLILEALNAGISPKEIETFFAEHKINIVEK
ncbi:anti-repressor SinI family protein [Bacillus sp. HMF5848]|nr:anti-repressor SinI family protein [Bacillus sp. HMF5848]